MGKEARLILVRHGESVWNKENRFTGWVDVDLSPRGEEEARIAGKHLSAVSVSRAFTSNLLRAQKTLSLILETSGHREVPVEKSEALNERHYGDLQGLNKDETAKKYGAEQVHIWRRSYDVAPPGGESLKMTRDRVLPYVHAAILPALLRGENCLVVAHGNSLRAMVMELDRMTKEQILELNIPTATPILYRLGIVSPEEGTVPGLPGLTVLEKKILDGPPSPC
ncbi:MAG: 2,3-bisphosphoglycerate-dependent phosphoglycerate mutase [Nitrospirae bacterium]|nr:2,3-bisphosphoglycerate-dependent phosphoglycerate mutase [Nitrospirota bacterium]MCL5285801.1 2,3-bisphosphoglycerate-dependent phosphoglycerate mutase [Nitrospirota bacterium]